MKNYQALLQDILDNGIRQGNRTGVDTLTLPGAMLKFDLRDGFPAVTTKKLAFNQVKGELIGFLRGSTSLAEFQALGCMVWDANQQSSAWQKSDAMQCRADSDDYLGRIYGKQWRQWQGHEPVTPGMGECINVDQIAVALDTVRNNPQSRRIIVNAWNPAELDQACLPPCHVLFQLLPHVESKVLHMTMYQRSCDMFLGVPFNIASYALLLELFAAWTGYTAGTLTMFLADAHIYVNHIDQVKEQLWREPMALPKLKLHLHPAPEARPLEYLLSTLAPSNIELIDYQSHAAIKAPMAV